MKGLKSRASNGLESLESLEGFESWKISRLFGQDIQDFQDLDFTDFLLKRPINNMSKKRILYFSATKTLVFFFVCEPSNGYNIYFLSYMNSRQTYNHHFQFSNYQKNVIRPSFHLLFSGLESLESLESLARLSCFSSRLSRLYFCQDFGSPISKLSSEAKYL